MDPIFRKFSLQRLLVWLTGVLVTCVAANQACFTVYQNALRVQFGVTQEEGKHLHLSPKNEAPTPQAHPHQYYWPPVWRYHHLNRPVLLHGDVSCVISNGYQSLVCDLNRTPIVMAKHGGSCDHFSRISTCGRTPSETVSHPQRRTLPTAYKISSPVYVIVTNKRLQLLETTLYNSLVLSFSLLKI